MSVQTEATDQRQAAVYRLYDANGALLYIGSSYNPERRYRDHYPKPWWPLVARRVEEWHPSKEAAYVAEMAAIAAEAPVHNEMGTPRYVPPSEKAAARRSHLAGELTVKGIMAKFGISRQSLHTYRQRPDFPSSVSRPGTGGLRWRENEVAAWFEANPPSQGKRTDLAPQQQGAEPVIEGQMGTQPLNGNDARALLGIVWGWIERSEPGVDPGELEQELREAGYGPLQVAQDG